jgi:alpha-beta hydrolase superfamily lysophospholipase
LAAFREAHSTSGWLIFGLAPVLWLDRHLFRLLPWGNTQRLLLAILIRVGFFLLGALFAQRMAIGLLTVRESIYLGCATTLSTFLLELALDLAIRLSNGQSAGAGRQLRFRNLAIMLVVVLLLFFISPLSVFHPISLATHLAPSLPYEDLRLRTSDGVQLPAWLVPHPEARGSLIFCHGLGGNREQSFMVMQRCHAMGLNVLAFDFRGHGDSPGHTATFGLREVPDVLAAEAYLVERYPDKPIFLFGISYGAAVALQALPQLQHVRGLWIESCFSRLSDAADHRFANLDPLLRGALIYTYSALIWVDCGCWPMSANPIDHINQAQMPIMFCHGKEDELVPFDQGQALYERYRGPKSCFWLDKGRHGILHLQGGEEYYRRLDEFFEACLKEPQGSNSR